MFLIIREYCWVWVHLVKRVRKLFLMILVNVFVLTKFLFLLFKGMACMWLKVLQFVLQTFLARVKLILIIGIADCVTITSAMFKSYRSRFKERSSRSRSSFSESFCDICAANKLDRKPPSPKMALRRFSTSELAHSDVRGPMKITYLGGHRYAMSFIDSCSRFVRAYFIDHKSEVLEKFRQFLYWWRCT